MNGRIFATNGSPRGTIWNFRGKTLPLFVINETRIYFNTPQSAYMRSLKVSGIIHLFAVLHAVVALSCHLAGINDELVLTLLTIVLIVLICLKRGLNVEFTAASVIVVNVIGYLLGTGGAQLIELLLHASPVVHAVSTFITTEILGWSIVWFTKLFRRGDDTASRSSAWTPRIGLLLLAVGGGFSC